MYLDGHTEQVPETEWMVKSQESSKHYVVGFYQYRRADDGDYWLRSAPGA